MQYESHKDIIDLWPSVAAFGADIGIPENTAKQIRKRNSIGPDHWQATVNAALSRGFSGVTLEVLLKLRPVRKPPAEEECYRPVAGPLFSTASG